MLKLKEQIDLKEGTIIHLSEDWHAKIMDFAHLKQLPYTIEFARKVKEKSFNEHVYIFDVVNNNKRSKQKIALSKNVVKYIQGEEVKDANFGFSFRDYLPFENSDILITSKMVCSNVQPAKFCLSIEEINIEENEKIICLDFRLDFLNGKGFTSLSYYTKSSSCPYTWKFLFNEDISYMTDFEKMVQDLYIHKSYVEKACKKLSLYLESMGAYEHAKALMQRSKVHDNSKIAFEDELYALSQIINDKSTLKDANKQLSDIKKDSLKLHWKHNTHHPEHYGSPVDMSKLDIMEMTCDWYARSMQYKTNFLEYVSTAQKTRFHFPEWMFAEIWHFCKVLANEV